MPHDIDPAPARRSPLRVADAADDAPRREPAPARGVDAWAIVAAVGVLGAIALAWKGLDQRGQRVDVPDCAQPLVAILSAPRRAAP